MSDLWEPALRAIAQGLRSYPAIEGAHPVSDLGQPRLRLGKRALKLAPAAGNGPFPPSRLSVMYSLEAAARS